MNKLIFYARNLCYLIYGLNLIWFTAFLGTMVFSLIQPTAFDNIVVTNIFQSGFGIADFKICSNCAVETDILLSDLGAVAKLWILARVSVFFILLILGVSRVINILRSVGSREAFYAGNVSNFKRMANYGFIGAILSAFNFLQVDSSTFWHFSLPLAPLSFALACLVLAEIFKEGEALVEDRQSII